MSLNPPSLPKTPLECWHAALTQEIALSIKTNDRQLLREQLYRARVAADDPRLADLVIIFPEKADELWIVRKDADEINR